MDRDFKYGELLQCPEDWKFVGPVAKNDFLIPPFRIFEAALTRTQTLVAMPMIVACHATLHQMMLGNANFLATGRGTISVEQMLDLRNSFPGTVAVSLKAQRLKMNARSPEEHEIIAPTLGLRHIDAEIESNPGMRGSLDAMFTSTILQSWTAFESLASDLWVAAIDNAPERLIRHVLNSNGLKKPDEDIKPKDLYDLKYDARTHLGSFLRDTRRVSFQSVKEIAKTYSIGFEKKGNDIFAKTNNGEVFLLAAFRNVFAHKNGSVDKDFVSQVENFPEFGGWQPPRVIELDGQLVGRLRNAATQMGLVLVDFVDQYITSQSK